MITQTTQLRVTLPVQLQGYLYAKAEKFGLSLSAYVKNLIINDVRDIDYPVFEMSKRTEEVGLKALEEHRLGKSIKVNNIEKYLNSL